MPGFRLFQLRFADHLVGHGRQKLEGVAQVSAVDGVELQVAGRASSSMACFLFVLLGLPVALAVRRADRMGAFGVAFLFSLFVYYPLVQIGRSLAEREVLTPTQGAWIGNVVLVLLSAGLWVRLFRR